METHQIEIRYGTFYIYLGQAVLKVSYRKMQCFYNCMYYEKVKGDQNFKVKLQNNFLTLINFCTHNTNNADATN